MAIIRWSSDDFKSDLYIYETAYGIQVAVAANHTDHDVSVLGPRPESPSLEELMITPPTPRVLEWAEEQQKWTHSLYALIDAAKRTPIDHPYAGELFGFETIEEVVEFLEKEIIPSGKFNVPKWLMDDLKNWELVEDESTGKGEVIL